MECLYRHAILHCTIGQCPSFVNFGVVLLPFPYVCSSWRSASLPSWDVSCLGSEGLLMPRLIFLREILSTRSLGNGLHERANRNHSCLCVQRLYRKGAHFKHK